MIGNKKLLAIIPARKNSKRIKNKNLAKLNNKPLISYTIEEALKNKYIDKIVVSTDDIAIRKLSSKNGLNVPKLRPSILSSDKSRTIDLAIYEINELRKIGEKFDYLIILQPTSPFRTNKHINESIRMLKNKKAKCIISVCKVGHPVEWTNKLSKSLSMNNFLKKSLHGKRSQDFQDSYRINGAIYIGLISEIIKQKSIFLNNKAYAYKMKINESIDIDEPIDLEFANFLSKKNYE